MAPAPAAPIQNYLDTLALALAAAATWWRKRLTEFRGHSRPAFSQAQLDRFEGHLTVGLAKLLLTNAQAGISWRKWLVDSTTCHNRSPQTAAEVLIAAATEAGIQRNFLPWATTMWLSSTADQVQVQVRCGHQAQVEQIWPVPAGQAQEPGAAKKPYTGPPRMYPVHPNDHPCA
jgi:hypothetical protein